MEDDTLHSHLSSRRSQSHECRVGLSQGMENVVATVSGYHGSERFNLIKLISHAGASYVGAMSRSVTHLVCWQFKGKKYNLAKKFKTIIVNHKWVEECIKQGRRVPEGPYRLQSGEEVGPWMMEFQLVAKEGALNWKHNIFSDRSDCYFNSERETGGTDLGACDLDFWTDSFLLNEHKEPNTHSLRSSRRKRKIAVNDTEGTSLAEPSSKGRKLVKKNAHRSILDHMPLDSEPMCSPNIKSRLCNRQQVSTLLNHSDGEDEVTIVEIGEISVDRSYSRVGRTNEGFNNIKGIENLDHPALEVSNFHAVDASYKVEITSEEEGSNIKNLEGKIKKKNPIENVTRLPASMELSCVICWTEFSSTRGVLPCGHRFCYSCIQNWADHMASRRKISTCPLCKACFLSITKVEDAACSDQKIYSQTIPSPSSTRDIYILPDQERLSFGAQSLASVCCKCRSWEPQDLLISCNLCQIRCIHSYCLDPFLLPWTCMHCKDLQMLYHHAC